LAPEATMNFALFGIVRIGNKPAPRLPDQKESARNLHAIWDQRFDRLSALLAQPTEN
jgi:hypothetical protein